MAEPIKALIVGAGHGCRVHRPALEAAGFEVVGLVGRDPERTEKAAAKWGLPRYFIDLARAIDATAARAITIASPPHAHCSAVKVAAERGCHIYCEKPFAADAREAEEMVAAAEEAGIVNFLGYQMRMRPERRILREAVERGLLGTPHLASFVQYAGLLAGGRLKMPGWWDDPAQGGGWLGASGSHMIDMVKSTLGEFRSVSAALPNVAQRDGLAEDSFIVRFTLASGLEGVMQQSGGAWGAPTAEFRIAGDDGTAWIDGGQVMLADAEGTRALETPPEYELPTMEPSTKPHERFLHVELPPSIRAFEHFRAAICGQDTPVAASFADGFATMKVLDAIRLSARNGGSSTLVG